MSKVHEMHIRVYYSDTDAAGIVYYANYLRFAEAARGEWLREKGYGRKEFDEMESCIGFAVAEVGVKYKSPAKLDDLLTVKTEVLEVGGASLKMKQNIYRDDTLLVEVNIVLVCVDKNIRTAKIPSELKAIIQGE